jgi:hypothetical protein
MNPQCKQCGYTDPHAHVRTPTPYNIEEKARTLTPFIAGNSRSEAEKRGLKVICAALQEAYEAGRFSILEESVQVTIDAALASYKFQLRKEIEELARQNTYEGDEALVYRTTMNEVLALLQPPINTYRCGKCDKETGMYPGSESLPDHARRCPKREPPTDKP